jgi:r-opsin
MDFNGTGIRFEARVQSGVQKNLGWNVSPEDRVQIPEHWLSYPEPEASIHYLLAILCIAFIIVGSIGNGLVIWVFTAAKPLKTPSNIFVVNLALFDFLMMMELPMFVYNSFYRGFAFGVTGCKIYAAMGAVAGIGASATNACIAFDRYNTIARPFAGKITRKKALFMAGLVWCYTAPWATLPFIELWGRYVPEGFLTACTFDYLTETFDNRMFVAVIFTFSYVIPMSLIIYYYSQIVSHVVNHEKILKEQAKKMNVASLRSNQEQQNKSVEIRIAKAAITMCFLFVASWTPYAVLALIGSFGDKTLLTPGVTMIPACTCKFVACLDPFVYAISHPRYRIELQRRLPWLAIHEKSLSDTVSMVTEMTQAQNNEMAAPQ